MMNVISVRDLFRVYRLGTVDVHALNGLSIDIEKGEFVGIMGPSGSGKSTLLYQISLLDRPSSGFISVQGTDVGRLSDRQRTKFRLKHFGYVFQDYALVPELTTEENVSLLPMALGKSDEECHEMSVDILDVVGLKERLSHLPRELSGGEQQRVAIARAMVNQPDIIFADEPCANLDSVNSKRILDLFKQLNQENGQTIVMISHEDEDIEYFDRVIQIFDGKNVEN
ncbi:ABC transporter ATP-binding protein [Methanospirillum purgamenti]|jgi:putative ABC transport system ATP-binding protein|nr:MULTISPECIES: ABC transporter ATP-binding protein [Methanospirillum]MDX8550496.1 ABC transporter ATP-binding protein [Methanospirillum hungatei]